MQINLTQPPATSEQLGDLRKHYSDVLKTIARRERFVKVACYAIGATGLVSVVALWWVGYVSGQVAVPLVVAGAVAVAVLTGSIVVADAVELAVALAFVFLFTFASDGAAAVAVAVSAFAIPVAVAFAYATWIESHRAQASEPLELLIELEHSTMPDECIAFAKWCGDDETVLHYQHQLATKGRKPTRAEYEAAKRWMAWALDRQIAQKKAVLARHACERMSMEM